jgi:hypothetical protein
VRAPQTEGRDVALDAGEELGEAEFRGKFHARSLLVGAEAAAGLVARLVGKPVGEGIDQHRLEPAAVGMAEFGFGEPGLRDHSTIRRGAKEYIPHIFRSLCQGEVGHVDQVALLVNVPHKLRKACPCRFRCQRVVTSDYVL